MTVIVLGTTAFSEYRAYQHDFRLHETQLKEMVHSRATLIGSVAKFDKVESINTRSESATNVTLSQLQEAHESYEAIGEGFEFTMAKQEGENIVFLFRHRFGSHKKNTSNIRIGSGLAEPMEQALFGKSGTIVGRDYRGEMVLAAYEPIPELDYGLVAKIDVAVIRAPFMRTFVLSGEIAIVLIVLGTYVFLRWVIQPSEDALMKSEETLRHLNESLERRVEERSKQLTERETQLQNLVDKTDTGIVALDNKGVILEVNDPYCRIFGIQDQAEIVGCSIRGWMVAEHWKKMEEVLKKCARGEKVRDQQMEFRHMEDKTVHVAFSAGSKTMLDGSVRILALCRDVTERKMAEEKMRKLSQEDFLTGLPNRFFFTERFRQMLAYAKRYKEQLAVLILDLNRFKEINDTIGHAAGDRLLQELAKRLKSCLRTEDLIARLGGDEFAVVLSNIKSPNQVTGVVEKILAELAAPVKYDGEELQIMFSIGIALFPGDGEEEETLYKDADAAMYEAKDEWKSCDKKTVGVFKFFDPKMRAEVLRRRMLKNDLEVALKKGQFFMTYQPQVDPKRNIVGAEALIRWRHPEQGIIPPGDWIDFAEEIGIIVPIGTWVIQEVCRQLAIWKKNGFPRMKVSVNVSGKQWGQKDFIQIISQALLQKIDGEVLVLDPDLLKLENTESIPITPESSEKMTALRQIGVELAIDDFGKGYSNLTYVLRRLFDWLKIDREFVRYLPENGHFAAGLIGLVHPSEIKVVAEGVETQEQFDFLQKKGCDLFQGYLFGRPLMVEEFEALVKKGGTGK